MVTAVIFPIQQYVDDQTQTFHRWAERRAQGKEGSLFKRIHIYAKEAEWYNVATVVAIVSISLLLFRKNRFLTTVALGSTSVVSLIARLKIGELLIPQWEELSQRIKQGYFLTKGDFLWDVSLAENNYTPDLKISRFALFKNPYIARYSDPKNIDDYIAEGKQKLQQDY